MPSPDPAAEGSEQPVLDLATARRWAVTARALLAQARERIDALNVFPVPDGDTGTNMFLTVDGSLDFLRGQHEVAGAPLRLDQGLALLARGMLLSARGNSGVILSQLARGLSEAVADRAGVHERGPDAVASEAGVDEVGPATLADAFERAADLAWAGVSRPVEGTILSVATAAATGAREAAVPGASTYDVAQAALEAARAALAQTTEQLPRLAAAGVVDAGGAGLVLVIEALENVLSGRPHERVPELAQWWEQHAPSDLPVGGHQALDGSCQSSDGTHEVMYLLEGSDPERAHHLRAHLVRIGSSVLVVGGPTQWRIHVHLDDPAPAVEAGSLAGRVEQVAITRLLPAVSAGSGGGSSDAADAQAADSRGSRAPGSRSRRDRPPAALGVVACAPGEGLAAVLARAGAEVVHSSAGRRASTGQLLGALRAVPAGQVIVLPNDPDTVLAAEAAARAAADEGRSVRVLPTRAAVQGLAAMAVCDLAGEIESTMVTMADAAAGVAYGALTVADDDGTTPAGPCRAGQWLGLVGGEIIGVHDRRKDAAKQVLKALTRQVSGPPELLTVVAGRGTDPSDLDKPVARWARRHDDVEVHRLDGGQPTYHWLLGLE